MKLRTRIAPVIVAEFRAGRDCLAGAEALAAWARRTLTVGSFPDAEILAVNAVTQGSARVVELIRLVDPDLVDLGAFVSLVEDLVNWRVDGMGTTRADPFATGED